MKHAWSMQDTSGDGHTAEWRPEREGENFREEVIRILTKVVPLSAENLQNTEDAVHRLGQKKRAGRPRQIIIQFFMKTVRDQVWKLSRNAKTFNELKIRFREDFCKEDREAHTQLWPKVEEARKREFKAYLRDGHAVIDGCRVVDGKKAASSLILASCWRCIVLENVLAVVLKVTCFWKVNVYIILRKVTKRYKLKVHSWYFLIIFQC